MGRFIKPSRFSYSSLALATLFLMLGGLGFASCFRFSAGRVSWAQGSTSSFGKSKKHLSATAGPSVAAKVVSDAIAKNHVMVFSKTYCPYCTRAKEALGALKVKGLEIYELDVRKDGNELQAALLELTGQRTVPNIFVGGKHIGGCDKTLEKIADGSLQKLLS